MEFALQRPEYGKWASAFFSLLMHGLLVLVLYYGVQWQQREPEPISVELVASLPPMVQTKPAVEEPPPVKPVEIKPVEIKQAPQIKPDIALKEPEKKKPVKKEEPKPVPPPPKPEVKPEVKPEKKPEVKPAEKKAEPLKMMDQERLLARTQTQIDAKKQDDKMLADLRGRTGTASVNALGSSGAEAKWMDAVKAKVSAYISVPPGLSGRPKADVEVELLVTGELRSEPKLVKSSGNPALDEAILRAIKRSVPFLKPPEKALGAPNTFTFDPLDPKFSN